MCVVFVKVHFDILIDFLCAGFVFKLLQKPISDMSDIQNPLSTMMSESWIFCNPLWTNDEHTYALILKNDILHLYSDTFTIYIYICILIYHEVSQEIYIIWLIQLSFDPGH